MKILFLNPNADAQQKFTAILRKKGHAVLLPGNVEEAGQILELHGASVDLAIIHREGTALGDTPGLKFIGLTKGNINHRDLPILLTSSEWSDADCARHQQGAFGVHAYLRQPFTEDQLLQTIDQIFGVSESPGQAFVMPELPTRAEEFSVVPTRANIAATLPPAPSTSSHEGFVLQDASAMYADSKRNKGTHSIITLEAPDLTNMDPAEASAQLPTGEPIELSRPSFAIQPPPAMASTDSQSSILQKNVNPPAFSAKIPPPVPTESAPQEISISESVSEFVLESSGQANSSPAVAQPQAPDPNEPIVFEIPDLGTLDPAFATPLEPPTQYVPSPTEFRAEFQAENNALPAELPPEKSAQIPAPHFASNAASDVASDAQVAQEMPYLFEKAHRPESGASDYLFTPAQPVGDSIVPGGAAHSPDTETLKKYLLLREQDVAILSSQLKSMHNQMAAIEQHLREEKARNTELTHHAQEQKQKIEGFETEKALAMKALESEVRELKFISKSKTDKARSLELSVKETSAEIERLKERVRSDIRKIRVREKELENRLEIMKKDSEVLIGARDHKIIELKRKLDLLEFNLDLLQDQYSREKENTSRMRETLAKAAQVIRVAGGLLDPRTGAELAASLREELTSSEVASEDDSRDEKAS